MKQKRSDEGQNGFWVKLAGFLVAAAIVVVLVSGSVQTVTNQMAELQRQLATKRVEFDAVSGQLAEANREIIAITIELDEVKNSPASLAAELESAELRMVEAERELAAARAQLDDDSQLLQDMTRELAEAESQLSEVRRQLDEATEKLDAAESELSTTRAFCESNGAFAELDRDIVQFDLLCQPLYPATIELKRGRSISVSVNLARFRRASGQRRVRFRIHFAVDHGRLEIHPVGSYSPQEISDSGGRNLRDFEISSAEEEVLIEITSVGYRGAKFDMAMWPL